MLTASLRQTARSNQLVLVDALVEYGKQLYELGRSKHSFSETVNAVIEKSPHLKPVMGAAWALISTWEKLHPTKVHPPVPWPYAAGTRGHPAGLGLVEIGFNFVVGVFRHAETN